MKLTAQIGQIDQLLHNEPVNIDDSDDTGEVRDGLLLALLHGVDALLLELSSNGLLPESPERVEVSLVLTMTAFPFSPSSFLGFLDPNLTLVLGLVNSFAASLETAEEDESSVVVRS